MRIVRCGWWSCVCLAILVARVDAQSNVSIPVWTNVAGFQDRAYSPNVLTVGGAGPAGPTPTILYAPADADDPAYRAAISAATGGAAVDYFDASSSTPDLATLLLYDAVYVWVNFPFSDPVAYGNVLASYVDGGGKVVLGAFCTYTQGNSLAGAIMTDAYCPVIAPTGDNLLVNDDYLGDGITEIHVVPNFVQNYSCPLRDDLVLQGAGLADGSYSDGAIACAYRPDFAVIYTNGVGVPTLGGAGQWAELIANACLSTTGVPPCPPVTGLTVDDDCPDVTLSWSNNPPSGQPYNELRIYRNGILLDAVVGTTTSYLDLSPFSGGFVSLDYAVEAVCDSTGSVVAPAPTVSVASCAQIRSLYAPAEADDPAYRAAIATAAQGTVDYFDARAETPSLSFLVDNYDAVYTWVNGPYADPEAFGDVLADYADAGGTVVLGVFSTYGFGNSLGGRIREACYCPVDSVTGENLFVSSNYQGDGASCMYAGGSVATLENAFRDDLIVQGTGIIDGTYTDGAICGALNASGASVHYTNGVGAVQLGGLGQWAEFVAGALTCSSPSSACGPVVGLSSSVDCNALEITINWAIGSFDAIEIEVDGASVASLPGTATEFTFDAPVAGNYEFSVRPICGGVLGCSATLRTGVDPTPPKHVILALESPALVDSVAALIDALETVGETQYEVVFDPLDAPRCGASPGPASIVWVMAGTFPENAVLDSFTGQLLCDQLASGGGVYIEGGDLWGFDAPTLFATCDGVDSTATDGDDSLASVAGAPGGPFDDPSWIADYEQDSTGNDFTDRIAPSDEGGVSEASWIEGGVLGYGVGIRQIGAGNTGNIVAQSWEFGGYQGDREALVIQNLGALGFGLGVGDQFIRGDANADGGVNIADAVFTLNALFVAGTPTSACLDAADVNDDSSFDVSDPVFLLNSLFLAGAPGIPLPHPFCGVDPTSLDVLVCPGGSPLCP